jgi:phytol kinase
MSLLIALAVTLFMVVTAELLWHFKIIRDELARKFVHITVGTFVAFWPYFMTWHEIQLMSLAFVIVIAISWKANVFRSVHDVKRRTWGELFFPIGIGVSALIMPPPIIFTAAILHLSLADGFAAIVGLRYGMVHKYSIRNYTKTIAGTATFWAISTTIVLVTVLVSQNGLTWPLLPLLVWLPLMATLLENVAVAGTDNIFVPLLIIVVLQAAHIT